MLWRLSIYILFLFYHTSNGQIELIPLGNSSENGKKILIGDKDRDFIKTLKAKRPPGINTLLPSQWALGPEGTPQWPNGEIKVYIDSDSYGDGIAGRVMDTLNKFQGHDGHLCPQIQRLKEKPTETEPVGSWLHVTNPDRVRPCVHDAGVDHSGEIKIVLGYDCLKPREILHTVLHGLGFRDEVTHPQRDLFVRVMWENIQPAFRSMFRILSVDTKDAGLMEYDPLSVMHFHDRAYSLNGRPTIMPMLPGLQVEPSDELSHLDKMKIKRMFSHECKKRLVGNVIHRTCASYDELKGEDIPANNGNGCPPVNTPGNDGDHIVIPGNDVKIEGDDQGANGNDVNDDQTGMDMEVGDGPSDNVIIPGNDVKVADSGVSDNDAGDGKVLVGDVNANEAVSDMSVEAETDKPVKEMKKLAGLKVEPSDELSHLDKMKIKRMFSHECKKRLVGNVIHRTCASYDELKGEDIPANNGNGCPPVNTPGNDGDHIVIPGNDVKIEGDDQEAIGNDVNDDQTGMDMEVGDGPSDNVIIPGNDVKVADSGVSDNDAGDLNANEAVSDMSVESETAKPVKKFKKLSDKGKLDAYNNNNIPDEEAIVVGYGPKK